MSDRLPQVIHGDSREVLKTLAACSVDSCVTDPPYALVSIVKRFGKPNAAPAKGNDAYIRASSGFMGQAWDTGETAFDPDFWREVLRVLKPGAHLVAFSGTRTYHRMVCAIEDAGFEIRDQLQWLYGSGFPKSHDVSKGIDRAAGAQREIIGTARAGIGRNSRNGGEIVGGEHEEIAKHIAVTAPASDDAKMWQGWGTALKPASEPIVLARKPLIGTVAENVLQHGTGAINIDGCRVGTEDNLNGGTYSPGGKAGPMPGDTRTGAALGMFAPGARPKHDYVQPLGRWPANVIHDGSDEVVGCFPETPGQLASVGPEHGEKASVRVYGDYGPRETFNPRGDAGSAARFFYAAKADAGDRLNSKHPTVKPVDLMQWLVRLVTPRGGLCLDPFAGTGTTGEAAWREGMRSILIEREERFVADIRRRIELMQAGPFERAGKLATQEAAESLPLFAA